MPSLLSVVKKYLTFLEKHTILSTIIVCGIVLASIPFIANLKIKPSVQDILPDKHEAVKNIKKLTEVYGGEGFLIVGLGNGNKKELIEFAEKVSIQAQSYSTIDYVAHRINANFFKSNSLLFLDIKDLKDIENRILKKIGEANPLYVKFDESPPSFTVKDIISKYNLKGYREYFMNNEETYLICLIKPIGSPNNVAFNRQLIKDINQIVSNTRSKYSHLKSVEVEYGGLYYEVHVDNVEILNDIFYLSLLAFIVITLALLLHYRRFNTLFIILVPLVVGILLNLALTQILVRHLTMLTGFLSGILMGLGLDFGIHVYSRYLFEKQSKPWRDALSQTLVQTGAASAGGALTTASAFYGISVGRFKGFSEFGIVAGNGMILTGLSILLLFPLIIVIYEKQTHPWFKIKGTLNQFSYKKKSGSFYKKLCLNYKYIRIVFALVFVFSLYYAFQVKYEHDFSKLKGKSAELRMFTDRAEAILNYSVKPIIIMSSNREVIKRLEKKYNKNIQNQTSEMMVSCQSINTFIPEQQEEKLVIINRLRNLYKKYKNKIDAEISDPVIQKMIKFSLGSNGITKKITFDDLPEQLTKKFVSKDQSTFLLIIHAKKYIYRYIPKLEKFHKELYNVEDMQGQFQLAGINYILTSITKMVREDAPRILILTIICLLVTLSILFRNIKDVLIVFGTVGMGILIMLGVMGFFGVKFNLFNVITMPIILGIGVDGAIHICHRLNEFNEESPQTVMDHVFKVILISSLTTVLGFVSLIGASYTGLMSIGLLTVIGISSVLVTSLIFLPAFLDFFYSPKKYKKKN